MKVITLIEDTGNDDNLVNEFGLALFIESNGIKILLDTGRSDSFIKNSKVLGIDLNDINLVILSHAHFDHCGGLQDMLQTNSTAAVYMHEDAPNEYYGNIGAKLPLVLNYFIYPFVKNSIFFSKYIGLNQDVIKQYGNRIKLISKTEEISKNIFLITNISKTYPLSEGNKFLLSQKDGKLVPDDFSHELILVIKESDGIVIFSGCCHSGILNMLETVRNLFKDQVIKAVIGGFHLKFQPEKDNMAGTKNDIEFIANEFVKQKIGKIYTGHCTGSRAYSILSTLLKERIGPLLTGDTIHI